MSDTFIFTSGANLRPSGLAYESSAFIPGWVASVRVWDASGRITLAMHGHAAHCGMVLDAAQARAVAAALLACAAMLLMLMEERPLAGPPQGASAPAE